MPNWCTNMIGFASEKKENLDKLLETIKGEGRDIDFEKIIPMPANIFRGNLGTEERVKYGEKNWYDWSCKHWNTKWNACDTELEREDDETAYLTFETAWSAPTPIIIALMGMCNALDVAMTYSCYEEACFFCGEIDTNDELKFYDMPADNAPEEEKEAFRKKYIEIGGWDPYRTWDDDEDEDNEANSLIP